MNHVKGPMGLAMDKIAFNGLSPSSMGKLTGGGNRLALLDALGQNPLAKLGPSPGVLAAGQRLATSLGGGGLQAAKMAQAGASLASGLGGAGGGLGGVAAALGPIAAAAGPVTVALGAVAGGMIALHAAALKFGAAADPYAMERYNLALDDLNATIGRMFVPVLDQFTNAVRLTGDVLASIMPSQAQFAAVFQELQPVWADLRDIMADIAPLIKNEWITALKLFALVLKGIVWTMKPYLEAAKLLTGGIGLLTGGVDRKDLDSSVGAAARPALFMGGEDLMRSNILGAYSSGSGDPAAETARNTKTMVDLAADIGMKLGELLGRGPVTRGAEG